jgi:hypothetical protein
MILPRAIAAAQQAFVKLASIRIWLPADESTPEVLHFLHVGQITF